jgi:hypothetical protein
MLQSNSPVLGGIVGGPWRFAGDCPIRLHKYRVYKHLCYYPKTNLALSHLKDEFLK